MSYSIKKIVNGLWGGDEGLDFLIEREDCQLKRQLMLSMKMGDGREMTPSRKSENEDIVIELSADMQRKAQNSLQWRKNHRHGEGYE